MTHAAATGGEQAGLLDELGRLIRAGRPADAVVLADGALDGGLPDRTAATVLLYKLSALLNLDDVERCPATVDAVHALLERFDDPVVVGEFHALAARVTQRLGALELSVQHLVRGVRALERAPSGFASATAWLDVAVTYSYIGFHTEAVEALARARRIAATAGLEPATFSHPEIRVRYALWLDQQGDTAGCVRELLRVNMTLGPQDIQPQETPFLVYAAARLAALGVRRTARSPCSPTTTRRPRRRPSRSCSRPTRAWPSPRATRNARWPSSRRWRRTATSRRPRCTGCARWPTPATVNSPQRWPPSGSCTAGCGTAPPACTACTWRASRPASTRTTCARPLPDTPTRRTPTC